jgi:hypothetical protein
MCYNVPFACAFRRKERQRKGALEWPIPLGPRTMLVSLPSVCHRSEVVMAKTAPK